MGRSFDDVDLLSLLVQQLCLPHPCSPVSRAMGLTCGWSLDPALLLLMLWPDARFRLLVSPVSRLP